MNYLDSKRLLAQFVLCAVSSLPAMSHSEVPDKLALRLDCDCVTPGVGNCVVRVSIQNVGDASLKVELPSEAFPFELEVLDGVGIDAMASKRAPRPTYRKAGAATHTLQLAGGAQSSYSIRIAEYITSRGMAVDLGGINPKMIRAYVPVKVGEAERFGIVWSDKIVLKGYD